MGSASRWKAQTATASTCRSDPSQPNLHESSPLTSVRHKTMGCRGTKDTRLPSVEESTHAPTSRQTSRRNSARGPAWAAPYPGATGGTSAAAYPTDAAYPSGTGGRNLAYVLTKNNLTPIEAQIGRSTAEEYAECSICFDPLCSQRCAVLQRNGRRTCRHLLHLHCAEAMQCAGRYNCPECRESFDSVAPLPELGSNNINEWFQAVDLDGDGRLSKQEVLQVLKAQYRLDWRALESHIDDLWRKWDQDGSGDLAFNELTAPGGLVHYITGQRVAQAFPAPRVSQEPPPSATLQSGSSSGMRMAMVRWTCRRCRGHSSKPSTSVGM